MPIYIIILLCVFTCNISLVLEINSVYVKRSLSNFNKTYNELLLYDSAARKKNNYQNSRLLLFS